VRILICDSYYPAVLERLYAQTPRLSEQPYAEQLGAVMGLHFGTADAYSHYLREHGHDAREIILNWEPVQRAWSREQGIEPVLRRAGHCTPSLLGRALRQRLLHLVAHAQIEAWDPDVLYLQDFWFFTRPQLARLRRPGRLIVGQLGSQPPSDGRLSECDLILTSFPHYVERVRALGIDCQYFAIGFDERVLDTLGRQGRSCDPAADERQIAVGFVGGIHAPGVHRRGTVLLEHLANEVDAQFWGYIKDRLLPDSPILSRHHGEAWGLDMYRVLASTQIAINRHGDIADGYANNMRLFEATGVGALLMTERAANLPGLFDPDTEVVTYEGAEDLVDKVRFYLDHPRQRHEIATAGQRRTLAEHTYRQRMGELHELLVTRVG
jgi:hypothetical protein